MKSENFLIAGRDRKMTECKKYLSLHGYSALNCTDDQFFDKIENYKNIILPLPTELDGIVVGTGKDINFLLKRIQMHQRIFYGNLKTNPFGDNGFCYYADEEFLEYNSELTAQGVLKLILDNVEDDIKRLKIAVTGFGKCGDKISRILLSNGADVTVFSRSLASRINSQGLGCRWKNIIEINLLISDYDVIINTVPYNILSSKSADFLTEKNLYIEIASKPYGFDISKVDTDRFRYVNGYSLPGRFTPVSAGKNIAQTVLRIIKEGESG